MSSNTRTLWALLGGMIVALSLSFGSTLLTERHALLAQPGLAQQNSEALRQLDQLIEQIYREHPDDDAERQERIDDAIRDLFGTLDAYSRFLDAWQTNEMQIQMAGQYGGVGLTLMSQAGNSQTRVSPMPGSPAERAGIQNGDVLIRVDGVALLEGLRNDAVERIRGTPGTSVTLELQRDGEDYSVTLVRETILLTSLDYEYLSDGYGYIHIEQFTQTTGRELRDAIQALSDRAGGELPGLILDLRNNPGGTLGAAVEVADAFLHVGLIVRAEGSQAGGNFQAFARPGDLLRGADLVVLVNGRSASASEIVAGALQDHGRAYLIGTTTYGKGTVQSVLPLAGGNSLSLTTAQYFTASGVEIDGVGIRPDLEVTQLNRANVVYGPGRLDLDRQLRAALEYLQERSNS